VWSANEGEPGRPFSQHRRISQCWHSVAEFSTSRVERTDEGQRTAQTDFSITLDEFTQQVEPIWAGQPYSSLRAFPDAAGLACKPWRFVVCRLNRFFTY